MVKFDLGWYYQEMPFWVYMLSSMLGFGVMFVYGFIIGREDAKLDQEIEDLKHLFDVPGKGVDR